MPLDQAGELGFEARAADAPLWRRWRPELCPYDLGTHGSSFQPPLICGRSSIFPSRVVSPRFTVRSETALDVTSDELTAVLCSEIDDIRRRLAGAGVATDWIHDELRVAWRDAQAEAVAAYAGWRNEPGAGAYAVYRAAQDRADAAQDMYSRHRR
jgi:hypothetical protein